MYYLHIYVGYVHDILNIAVECAMAQMPSSLSHDNHFSSRQTRTANGILIYIYIKYLYVNKNTNTLCVVLAKMRNSRVVKSGSKRVFRYFDSAAKIPPRKLKPKLLISQAALRHKHKRLAASCNQAQCSHMRCAMCDAVHSKPHSK